MDQLQQQYREAGDKLSEQLMQVRQAALDEALNSNTQHQAALDRAAENGERLQRQVDSLTSALQVKEAELQAAHKQLAAALDSAQQLEVAHGKVSREMVPKVYAVPACRTDSRDARVTGFRILSEVSI